MNTLQESSRIYKAFKKGGPSFGGWQVRGFRLFGNIAAFPANFILLFELL